MTGKRLRPEALEQLRRTLGVDPPASPAWRTSDPTPHPRFCRCIACWDASHPPEPAPSSYDPLNYMNADGWEPPDG